MIGLQASARSLINSLMLVDRSTRDPGRILVRVWGLVLLLLVILIQAVFGTWSGSPWELVTWSGAYLVYVVLLELARRRAKRRYEESRFRGLRVLVTLVMITWLIAISLNLKPALWPSYLVPILAAILYFDRPIWTAVTIVGAAIGLCVGGIILPDTAPLTLEQYCAFLVVLVLAGIELHRGFRRSLLLDQLVEFAQTMHQTLDLERLLAEMVKACTHIAAADRGLGIVIDPQTRRFIAWSQQGFDLREGRSIEELAMKCTVLKDGNPFECDNLTAVLNSESVYERFFLGTPRSVLAEPILNKDGKLLGVMSVAHEVPYRFDRRKQDLLRLLSYIVGSAVDNCLIYRQARLRHAGEVAVSEALAKANDEEEIARLLASEARQLIPTAEGSVLHRFEPKTGLLKPWQATHCDAESLGKSVMAVGQGIAGHALEIKEPIVVFDVAQHPWFVESARVHEFSSLAVAPVYDQDTDAVFGTLSVHSSEKAAFDSTDEANLTSLCHQGAIALTRVRALADAVQHGNLLERIIVSALEFDVSAGEDNLCKQIAACAREVLGFEATQVQILDPGTQELVTVVMDGLPEREVAKREGHRIPLKDVEPLLSPEFRRGRSFLIPQGHEVWRRVPLRHFYTAREDLSGYGKHPGGALLTPLEVKPAEVIGLLSLNVPETEECLLPQTIGAVGVFATTAAWAIERVRDARRLQEQQQRTEAFLKSISSELARSRDLDAIGEVAVRAGAELIGAEGCSLYMVRGNLLEHTHSTHLAGTEYIGRVKPVSDAPGSGIMAWVAATGQTLRLRDGEERAHPAWGGEMAHLVHLPSGACKSLLVVPIIGTGRRVIGVLHLENRTGPRAEEGFDQQDEARLEYLAEQVALAVEKVGLYEVAERWEREGIEDDIHELINWYHSGVVLWLETMQQWYDRGRVEKAMNMLPALLRQARTTLFELKTIHTTVSTRQLEAESMDSALHRMASAWAKRASSPVSVNVEVNVRDVLPPYAHNILLRIAVGAIGNAIVHSGGDFTKVQVWVRLRQDGDQIVLEVEDNGRGIEPPVQEGYGISRMRQLARQLQSDLEIDSKRGKGTKVSIRAFPWS